MDPKEIKAIAAQLACPVGEMGVRIAQSMNRANAGVTRRCIEALSPQPGQTVIEVGPGNGVLSLPVLKCLGPEGKYIAIERSQEMVRALEQTFADSLSEVEVFSGPIEQCALPGEVADGLIAVNVLYFLENLGGFFKKAHRCLKPGGRVVCGVLSRASLEKLPISAYGFGLFSDETIVHHMESAGFTVTVRREEEISELRVLESVPTPLETAVFMGSKSKS